MTIRSTDMQVLMQKVGDVSRIQHTQKADHDARQQQFAQQITQETRNTSKTVQDLLRSENIIIHEEEEREKKKQNKKKKKANQATQENAAEPKTQIGLDGKGNKLDIRV